MIEIIPNWHPILVHFTVALITVAVAFYWLSFIVSSIFVKSPLAQEFEIVGRWCLWFGAIITIGTVAAGFYAYFTVKHDAPSHLAMIAHRNWALVTATSIVLIALWSVVRYVHHKKINITFLIVLLIIQGLLLTTAWHGAELVYRHGLGVMSMPQVNNKNAGHEHKIEPKH
ncbi:MAG: hypothetical protein ACD_46C00705G0002 [uncultured bacterium]|nr:MAG: hypothetical protein ACD_46C00705G0002 [uncultured bacterium]